MLGLSDLSGFDEGKIIFDRRIKFEILLPGKCLRLLFLAVTKAMISGGS